MPPSAVVDASVLVSAFLLPGSVPGSVLRLAAEGRFLMHLSPIILEETRRSLLKPRLRAGYGRDEEAVLAWCAELRETGTVLLGPLPDIGRVCRDPDDDHVLAAALAVGAGVIVTGDKDLLALDRYGTVRILTARAFLAEIAPEAQAGRTASPAERPSAIARCGMGRAGGASAPLPARFQMIRTRRSGPRRPGPR